MKRGDFDKAEQEFKAVLALNPHDVLARMNLGALYAHRGMLDAAERELKAVLARDPSRTDARLNLGAVYGKKGVFEGAEREFREVLARDPNNASARANLGTLYLEHYFPVALGARWTYAIELSKTTAPLLRREIKWVLGNQIESNVARPRIPLTGKTATLTIRISGPIQSQDEYVAFGLEIDQDDLGIFAYHENVVWTRTQTPRPMVYESVTYPPDTPLSPSRQGSGSPWRQAHGISSRLLFFFDKPGTNAAPEERVTKETPDVLLFRGIDSSGTNCRGSCLHFVRTVTPAPGPESQREKIFVEETWFERGKGLVRLIQKVGGQVSMTWKLVSFTQAKEAVGVTQAKEADGGPIWERRHYDKTGEVLKASGVTSYDKIQTIVQRKPPFWSGTMPLTYTSMTPNGMYRPTFHEFAEHVNNFFYLSEASLRRGVPDGAQTLDLRSNRVIAEARTTRVTAEVVEIEELHYDATGGVAFRGTGAIQRNTGFKTTERALRGKSRHQYYFVYPVGE